MWEWVILGFEKRKDLKLGRIQFGGLYSVKSIFARQNARDFQFDFHYTFL